ncbi:PHR domain-containing protein [Ditylenchus destructor]|uniref:PHR domain-containing protein n=1 Tax=Ditylenchus destructor TaxID=166010 RepID=A0AAD4MTT9_9BILA|nr:PHR domain-containing protein [Ditylenchus destructor]
MTPPPREPTNDNGLDLAEEIVEDESGVLEVKVESRPEHNTPENAPGPSHSVHREERRRSANDLSCRCKEKCNTLSLACQCLSKSHSLSPIHCGSPKDNAGTVCGQKVKKTASSACANFYKLAGADIVSAEELVAVIDTPHSSNRDNLHIVPAQISSHPSHQPCANQRRSTIDGDLRNHQMRYSAESCSRPISAGDQPSAGNGNATQPMYYRQGLGWQSTKQTVKDRMEFMCLNEHLADVYFVFTADQGQAQRQRIPAHKFVLAIGSAVFDAMFKFGSQADSNSTEPLEIELVDVEPKALTALLTFLYTDEVSISPDSVMSILYTAKKYAVPALETFCVNFLKDNLNAENAFMLLSQARLFDESQLTELCLAIIDRDTTEALMAEGFTDVDHDTLCNVLKRDSLRINELPLFQALLRWSIEACKRKGMPITPENQRQILGPALRLVRYSQMTVQEFAEHVALSKLLTDAELVSVFLHFTLTNPTPPSVPVEFPVAPRRRFVGKEMSINRFQRIETSWGYSGNPDRIKFTVDAPIYVLGFGLYGSINGPSDYSVTIEIINFGSGQVVASHDTTFLADGTPSIFRVKFKEPVEILSGLTYIASARLKGAESHYGTKGLRRIVRQTSPSANIACSSGPASGSASNNNIAASAGDSAITFQFSYAAGINNGTSVDDGQIPEIVFCQKF